MWSIKIKIPQCATSIQWPSLLLPELLKLKLQLLYIRAMLPFGSWKRARQTLTFPVGVHDSAALDSSHLMAGIDGDQWISYLKYRVEPKKKSLEVHKTLGEGVFIPILNHWRLKCQVSILWTRMILSYRGQAGRGWTTGLTKLIL